ncbi:TetR/AcrR family transcriptional regulator [Microbacterium sp. P05]|uniref:TetR/AcrR family transcriptional regulator n=1 Tax=Microbacterium sp. P05 TaxID=3366948 RepID=UPI0037477D65
MRRIPPQQRREELVAAAIRVMAQRGVPAATTRAIVAEADMPLGAFSYIFGTQDELMHAVIETVTEQERFAAQAGSIAATSVEAAIRNGLNAYIDLLVAHPERELVSLELGLFAARHRTVKEPTQWETYFSSGAQMLQYAADLTRTRWTAPTAELARPLVAFIDGITLAWLADRDTDAARRTAAFAAASIASHSRPLRTQEVRDAH